MASWFRFVFGSRFVGLIPSPLERSPRCVDCGAGVFILLGLAPSRNRCGSWGGGRLVRVGASRGGYCVMRVSDVAVRRVIGGGSRG